MAPRKKKETITTTTEVVVETKSADLTTETRKQNMSEDSIVELDMNLADYDDFEPLPSGEYPATVTLSEMRTSDKGNDYYYLTFQVHPDDYPADYPIENAPEGTNLTYARVQKPDPKNRRSITNVKNLMRALGCDIKVSVINPGEWEGKKAKLVLKKDSFNGMPTNSIVAVEALD